MDLDFAGSLEEVLQRIAAYAAEGKNIERSGWLRGRGWTQDSWSEGRFPTAADLDQVAGQVPALMTHKSGHATWVNSRTKREIYIYKYGMGIVGHVWLVTTDPKKGKRDMESEEAARKF